MPPAEGESAGSSGLPRSGATHTVSLASPVTVSVVTPEKPPSPPKSPGTWDRFVQVMPLVQAVLLAFMAYVLTGSVSNSIQKRQLELNNVKEMQSLLGKLYGNQSPQELASTVAALTTFREHAVPPLAQLMQSSEPIHQDAAAAGLRALALDDSAAVVKQLLRIIDSRNQICTWRMRSSAVELVGHIRCREALPSLRNLQAFVFATGTAEVADSTERFVGTFARISAPQDPPTADETALLRKTISEAVARIDGPARMLEGSR